MSIVLVRHGETSLNAARVIQPADTPLSERGRAQAEAVARRLAERPPAGILSSDLPRARETAAAIAAATGVTPQLTSLLQERNFGEFRGRAYDELGFDPLACDAAPPGGESVAEFDVRVSLAFAEICALRDRLDGDLVVVSHGLVIRTLLARHARCPADPGLPASLANTSVSIIDVLTPYEAVLVNCTRHLTGDARDSGTGLSGF